MAKVIVTAQVDDGSDWESKYRSHADLFRSQGVHSPVHYAVNGDNGIAISLDVDDVDAYMKSMESPETAAAMAHDGVHRETVRFFVLDREWDL